MDRRCAIAFVTVAMLVDGPWVAADPRSDFYSRMLVNDDPRVRMSAALRLGDLRASDSVEPLATALGRESSAATRIAFLSALTSIGDARALPAVIVATHDPAPAVRAQAIRAAAVLRTAHPLTTVSSPPVGPRIRIGVGTFAFAAGDHAAAVRASARRLLSASLSARPEVELAEADAPPAARRLRGFVIDGAVQTLGTTSAGAHAEVSLVVQTDPGREFRFESAGSATVPGISPDAAPDTRAAAEEAALRAAVESATARTLTQLAATR